MSRHGFVDLDSTRKAHPDGIPDLGGRPETHGHRSHGHPDRPGLSRPVTGLAEENDHEPRRSHRWWRVALACVIVVICSGAILVGLKWALFEWIDRGMTTRTYESTDGARSMAEGMGLVLVDGDDVTYGEVTSSFPDSSAYLVITTSSAERSRQLLHRSGLPPSGPVTSDFAARAPENHGPAPSPTLVTSHRWDSRGYLTATWDPLRAPRVVYVSASQT